MSASTIGLSRDSEEFRTNTRRLGQFAEAIGDTHAAHLAGAIATPVFHHVPVMQSMVEVLDRVTKGFILHGEQDFIYHQPIVPGLRLYSESRLIGTRTSSAGALYHVRCDTRSHDGRDIGTQYATCLVQGETVEEAGETPLERPKPARNGNPMIVSCPIAADQTARYAEAARDYSPYTLDPEAARANGLPAPIVHGMCTLALIARGLIDLCAGGDVRRIKRLACRFSHPLFLTPGQELRAKVWRAPEGASFEAEDRDGHTVVKNGFVEVLA